MKLKKFEQAIIAKGLKPKEVRLEHSNVKWFVCDGNYDYGIIVFDKNGKGLCVVYLSVAGRST